MTPEQHVREAERLAGCLTHPLAGEMTYEDHRLSLAAAQVHATLALAGATLLAGAAGYDAARGRLADAMLGVQR